MPLSVVKKKIAANCLSHKIVDKKINEIDKNVNKMLMIMRHSINIHPQSLYFV